VSYSKGLFKKIVAVYGVETAAKKFFLMKWCGIGLLLGAGYFAITFVVAYI